MYAVVLACYLLKTQLISLLTCIMKVKCLHNFVQLWLHDIIYGSASLVMCIAFTIGAKCTISFTKNLVKWAGRGVSTALGCMVQVKIDQKRGHFKWLSYHYAPGFQCFSVWPWWQTRGEDMVKVKTDQRGGHFKYLTYHYAPGQVFGAIA